MSNSIRLTAIVEISRGSRLKYEVNKSTGRLTLDRVLYGACVYPYNYGYIEGTLDRDGDPLDVVIVSQEILQPGVEVPVRIIGAMKMIDSGDRDTKLIGVVSVDPRYDEWNSLEDMPKAIPLEIKDFFSNYKRLENKEVMISGFVSAGEDLQRIIQECSDMHREKFGQSS